VDDGGNRLNPKTTRPKPSAVVALALAMFGGPGLGHVYAGRYGRGFAWAALPAVTFALALALTHGARGLVPLGVLLAIGLGALLVLCVDTVVVAAKSDARASFGLVAAIGVGLLVYGAALRLGVRAFVLEAFKVPSGSMTPTVLVGDHILIDKTRAVRRGDIVVFPFPETPEQDFVKRVLGLPGDRIEFHDGHPSINGAAVASCRLGPWSYADSETQVRHTGDLFAERIGDALSLAFYDDSAEVRVAHQGPFVVAPGEVFVVGDNRLNAYDSRLWFEGRGGGVPIRTIRGVAFVIWLSTPPGAAMDGSRFGQPLGEAHLPKTAAPLDPELARCARELFGQVTRSP